MKILFLQREPIVQMGIIMISAMVKQSGHQSFLLVESLERNFGRAIHDLNPDIIALSATTGFHKWACYTAERIKKLSEAKVILGGCHATFFPEVIYNEGIDIICRGEGEYAIVELLERLSKNEPFEYIKNLWVKKKGVIYKNDLRPLIQDLDCLPFLDRSLYDKYRYIKLYYEHHMLFMAGRGCNFDCNFCFNRSMKQLYPQQKYTRRRSADNVILELIEIKNRYQATGVQFLDDIFPLDHEWLQQFCENYKRKINLPFTCNGHFSFLNRRIVRDLKRAGCITIKVGLEAGNDYIRRNLLNKNITKEKIYEVCQIIKEEKLNLLLFNMMGYPNSSLKEELETLEMNIRIKPKFSICHMLVPCPRTQITEYAMKNGYLEENYTFDSLSESDTSFGHSFFKFKNKEQVINLHKFFMLLTDFPFLLPLVRLLIKLPPNKIYYNIVKTYHAYVIWKADKLNIFDCLEFAFKVKTFFYIKSFSQKLEKLKGRLL